MGLFNIRENFEKARLASLSVEELEKEKERLRLEYIKAHKKELRETEERDFKGWIKDLGILFAIIILIILIKVIFF